MSLHPICTGTDGVGVSTFQVGSLLACESSRFGPAHDVVRGFSLNGLASEVAFSTFPDSIRSGWAKPIVCPIAAGQGGYSTSVGRRPCLGERPWPAQLGDALLAGFKSVLDGATGANSTSQCRSRAPLTAPGSDLVTWTHKSPIQSVQGSKTVT